MKLTKQQISDYAALAKYLRERSKEICRDNKCTEDNHNCESYAYIRDDGALLDVCLPDYFQGCSQPYAAVLLPWTGNGRELAEAVENDLPID